MALACMIVEARLALACKMCVRVFALGQVGERESKGLVFRCRTRLYYTGLWLLPYIPRIWKKNQRFVLGCAPVE